MGIDMLARTGDDYTLWIIVGIVAVALILLIVAFVLSRRSKRK